MKLKMPGSILDQRMFLMCAIPVYVYKRYIYYSIVFTNLNSDIIFIKLSCCNQLLKKTTFYIFYFRSLVQFVSSDSFYFLN